MIIESISNERVKNWIKLHQKKYRDESNLFLCEEEHLINEALAKGIVKTIIIRSDSEDIFKFKDTVLVTNTIMDKLSTNVSRVKYIGVCSKIEETFKPDKRVLLLDRVQDPGNLGTLIRSAVSFGYNQIVCSLDCVDVYNEKTIRATQGALFYANIIKMDLSTCIDCLKEDGFMVVSLALNNSIDLKDLKPSEKMAFILGNEGSGISEEIILKSDVSAKITMKEFESLNVSIAGSIAMYSFM